MNKFLLSLFAALLMTQCVNAQFYSGSLTASSPLFDRPDGGAPPVSTVSSGNIFHYTTISLTVATPGTYTFESTSYPASFDPFIALYNSSGFSAGSPLTNIIAAVDDGGVDFNFYLTQTLSAGTYTIVITSYSDGVTGTFDFGVTGPAAVALPLNLINFSGRSFASYNNLEWSTGSEKATASFELQRSADARDFRKIASIDTKGDGNNSYAHKDSNPAEGNSYYRLKMIDKDGQFTFSNTIQIASQQSGTVAATVTPNPTKGMINVLLQNNELIGTQGSILNLSGQTIQSFNVNAPHLEFNIAAYPAGIYIIRFQSGELIRFTKQD